MLWFYLAGSSVLFFSALNILQRSVSIDIKNPRLYSVVFNTFMAVVAILYFFTVGNRGAVFFPSDRIAWVYLGIAALFFGLTERYRFYLSQLLDASINSIISNVSVLVAFLGALVLYNEQLALAKALGVILILIALYLVGRSTRSSTKVSLKVVLLGVCFWTIMGIAWMLDKKGASYFSPDLYNLFVWTIPLSVVIFPLIKPKVLLVEFKKSWKAITIMGMLNFAGYLMQLKAVQIAEATKVIPVVQTSTLVTVILGIIILKEKDNLGIKILAGIVAFIGVYFLVAIA